MADSHWPRLVVRSQWGTREVNNNMAEKKDTIKSCFNDTSLLRE